MYVYIYIYIEREREREREITFFEREIENKMIKYIVISQPPNNPSHDI